MNKGYYILNEFLHGMAVKKGVTEKDVDPVELKNGIEVEKEHTPDENIARTIALDHLAEIPDYYTRLKKLEDTAKKQTEGPDLRNKGGPAVGAGGSIGA